MPTPTSGRVNYDFDQFYATRRQTGAIAFSPEGDEIAYIDDTSGQPNLWVQPAAGGWPRQLTLFEKAR